MIKITWLLFVALVLVPLSCGGSSGSSAPATADAFCTQQNNLGCDKIFGCVPAAQRDASFTATFGTSADNCKTMSTCAGTTCGTPYSSSLAATCLSKLNAFTCTELLDPNAVLPAECDQACPQ